MAVKFSEQRRSLLESNAIIQVPWVKVTIGDYTFGVWSQKGDRTEYRVQFPNYVKSLNVTKINGQVNEYTLEIAYPITHLDDPNFFEKVISSVSTTRKIVFTYGDATQPAYVYKDEEAIITKVTQTFQLESSTINYTIYAISGAALKTLGCQTFGATSGKPSDIIKNLFRSNSCGLKDTFIGMTEENLDELIQGDDKSVSLDLKINISVMEYITYLVSCMIPEGQSLSNISSDIYILTMHDDTIYDQLYNDSASVGGPYFKVEKTSYYKQQSDAYEINIGFNNSNIVRGFSIDHQDNYALYYKYQSELVQDEYKQRINDNGELEELYSPSVTSKNRTCITRPDDITWWTKITKFPIKATLTVQGLLRPAHLMTYLRLHVLFYGAEHISSGLYIVTKQTDSISDNGYLTQLNLVKISGDGERYFPDNGFSSINPTKTGDFLWS